jgi:hypothetical protein
VFGMPVLTIAFVKSIKAGNAHNLLIFFIPLVFMIGGNNIIEHYFTSDQFKSYEEFNKIRGKLHGFSALHDNKNIN